MSTGVTDYVTATIDACSKPAPHDPHLRMSVVWPHSADRTQHPLWCLGQYDQTRQTRRVVIGVTDGVAALVGEGVSVVGSAYHEEREPGECGECRHPEDFDWDPTRIVNDGPVITCHRHGALAPGWAYMSDDKIGLRGWETDAPVRA